MDGQVGVPLLFFGSPLPLPLLFYPCALPEMPVDGTLDALSSVVSLLAVAVLAREQFDGLPSGPC